MSKEIYWRKRLPGLLCMSIQAVQHSICLFLLRIVYNRYIHMHFWRNVPEWRREPLLNNWCIWKIAPSSATFITAFFFTEQPPLTSLVWSQSHWSKSWKKRTWKDRPSWPTWAPLMTQFPTSNGGASVAASMIPGAKYFSFNRELN